MLTQLPEQFTPREIETMRYESEIADKQMAYGEKMKQLDIEAQKLDIKLSNLIRIPITIVKLPLLILLGIAYIVHVIKKSEPSEDFWKLLK